MGEEEQKELLELREQLADFTIIKKELELLKKTNEQLRESNQKLFLKATNSQEDEEEEEEEEFKSSLLGEKFDLSILDKEELNFIKELEEEEFN